MRIQANYADIRAAGSRLSQMSSQYESLFAQMNSRMNELQALWQGSDSQAFLSQLETVRPKMLQLKSAVDAYAAMLLHNADAYEALQANRTAGARML